MHKPGHFQEQEPGGPEYCACPDCDYETEKRRGIPCRSMTCPECGVSLEARVEPPPDEEAAEEIDPYVQALQDAKAAAEVALAVINGSGELSERDADEFLRRLRDDADGRIREAFNWSAKSGGQIFGNLYRGAGGKFTSGGDAGSGEEGEGEGEGEDEEGEGGTTMTMSHLNWLINRLESGEIDSMGVARLRQVGVIDDDGKIGDTGKEIIKAVRSGDIKAANEAIQSTVEPGKRRAIGSPISGKKPTTPEATERPEVAKPGDVAKKGGGGKAKKEKKPKAGKPKEEKKEEPAADKKKPKGKGPTMPAPPSEGKAYALNEPVISEDAAQAAAKVLSEAFQAEAISEETASYAMAVLAFAVGAKVSEADLKAAADALGFLEFADGVWTFTDQGTAFIDSAIDGRYKDMAAALGEQTAEMAEYGRRLRQEKVREMREAVDQLQDWIDEMQGTLGASERLLNTFRNFLSWAEYDDSDEWHNMGGKAVPIEASADFQEGEGEVMPYGSMKQVNPAIKGIDPPVTLAQANVIAGWADAMADAEDGPENAWAAAISQFKKLYEVKDGKWLKQEDAGEVALFQEENMEEAREAKAKRSEQYGIHVIEGKSVTKPEEYEGVPESQFGDPVNWAYPADKEHAPSVAQFFNRDGMREKGGYTPEDWAIIGKRLAGLLTKNMPATYEYENGQLVHASESKEAHMRIIEALRAGNVEDVIDVLEASNEAMLVIGRILQAISDKDEDKAKEELSNLKGAIGESASLYGYPPQQNEGFLIEVDSKTLRKHVNDAIAMIEDGDWEGAKRLVGRVKNSLKGDGDMEETQVSESEGEEGNEGDEGDELQEIDLREELGDGVVVSVLNEAAPPDAANPDRAPVRVLTRIIRPGWGNERDNNYYPREVLERDAHAFEGADMYVTDHKAGDKSERTKVASVNQTSIDPKDGSVMGLVTIYDPDLAEKTRNRARAQTLSTMRCSIYAKGLVKPDFEKEGRKGNLVEAIRDTPRPDVDWVTRDGAGGHAVEILATERVQELLSEVSLPDAAKEWVAEKDYQTEAQLQEAIDQAAKRVKSMTGSGQPLGEGGNHERKTNHRPPSGEERLAEYQDIRARYLPDHRG